MLASPLDPRYDLLAIWALLKPCLFGLGNECLIECPLQRFLRLRFVKERAKAHIVSDSVILAPCKCDVENEDWVDATHSEHKKHHRRRSSKVRMVEMIDTSAFVSLNA